MHVYPTGCITVGMKGQQLAPHGSLQKAGVVALTDDGACVQSNEIMRRAVEYAKMFNLTVLDHCQDDSLTEKAVMNEGVVSTRLGLKGWPHAAEDIIVARNIILSRYTGAHIHMQHISSAHSVELMRQAKKDGVNVTAEATPHHIAFTDEALGTYDTNLKMNPPLRTEQGPQGDHRRPARRQRSIASAPTTPRTRRRKKTRNSTTHPTASSDSRPPCPCASMSSSSRANSA